MPRPAVTTADLERMHPLREVWTLAWPTIVTMTSYTVMQFTDKLMVGQVGPLELTAQSNGAIWAFNLLAALFGTLTVVNTFVAQNLGAGRPERGPVYAWAGIWLGIAVWAVILLPYAAVIPWIFEALPDHSPRLRELETDYARILLVGAIVLLLNKTLHHYFFGLHRPRVVTVSAIAGNIANVLFNYALIFGADGIPAWGLPGIPGLPALGVHGAALGTVLGTTVELLIPLCIFLGPTMHGELKTRAAWRPRLRPIRDLLRIGWPASVQWGTEVTCWAIFMSVLVGLFGEDHMAAGWIALGYMHLSFMPALGVSTAVTSLVGRYIGAGKPDVAVSRTRLGLVIATGYMTLCAIVFLVFREPLVELFIADDVGAERAARIISIGGKLMICAAVFQTVDAFGITYTGGLRGAGDTVWPGVVTIIYSWTLIVAGGWTVAKLFPGLESVGPWIAAAVFIIVYGVTMAWRFESGRWRSINLLRHDDEPAVAAGLEPHLDADAAAVPVPALQDPDEPGVPG